MMVGRWSIALACVAALACSSTENRVEPAAGEDSRDAIDSTTDAGKVVATVRLTPAKPRVGDVLTLTLSARAEPGVAVELPPFGEALGRFTVVKFTPRTETDADGATTHTQIYQLTANGSGRQRIPQLRLSFRPDPGAEPIELLTDEIPIEIESVVAATELGGELGPAPSSLDETPGLPPWSVPVALVVLAGLAVGSWLLVRGRRRARARELQIHAFDRAMRRLEALATRGAPAADDADDYFVELSGIVRRYLEDRLGVRAPELTTEEFLTSARNHARLHPGVRDDMSRFLSTCDQVKFAGYRPAPSESEAALVLARQILEAQEARVLDQERAENTAKEAA